MRDDRWQRVKRLFEVAVEQPPSERSAFVLAAVAGDDTLRREVDALLEADDAEADISNRWPAASESLLAELRQGRPTAGAGECTFAADERVGPYRILALLGTGGMGEVFRAHDGKLNREVALKVLPRAYELDPDRLARFRREAQALAALNHSHSRRSTASRNPAAGRPWSSSLLKASRWRAASARGRCLSSRH
jgi:eukaryotic-like serine/threonine-protein kinase